MVQVRRRALVEEIHTELTPPDLFELFRGEPFSFFLDSGILAGITRKTVLEIASQLSLPTAEHDIRQDELFAAEEAFLTNSLIEVMPLTEVDDRQIGSGKAGAITIALLKAYRELVQQTLKGRTI